MVASDTWITTKAKVQLLRNLSLSRFSVEVDTRDGVVTVSGVVASRAMKGEAEKVLMEIEGVRGVENYLQIVPELAVQSATS